jgi:hypothetical protein
VQVELFVVFEHCFGGFCFLLEHACVLVLSSRCPCQGTKTFLFQVILLFAFDWLSIACLSFSFSRFFSVPFLFGYQMCVLSMHSSMGD